VRGAAAFSRPRRFHVAATDRCLGTIAAGYNRFTRDHQVPNDVRRDMYVALEEIVSNVVRHGSGVRAPSMTLTLSVQRNRFTIDIVDDGVAFDPFEHQDPDTTQALSERPIGGLGLLFVRRLTDGHTYRRRANRNHVRLMRRLSRSGRKA
jgi:serine/threonine-protein kinase RsbW